MQPVTVTVTATATATKQNRKQRQMQTHRRRLRRKCRLSRPWVWLPCRHHVVDLLLLQVLGRCLLTLGL
eukprot:COSAG02_NODE_27638_length_605_cov_1.079051_2_plen_68_part_01